MDEVILVDEMDREVGFMEKMEAHRKGVLHRAFSVVLFNSKGEILLQKRSLSKYHSAGLWTNTCCSHPKPNEPIEVTVRRRLNEEMGIDLQPTYAYKFLYHVSLENNLIEHELDYVFTGQFNGEPAVNFDEVSEWKFASIGSVKADLNENPELYTAWFKLILEHPQLR